MKSVKLAVAGLLLSTSSALAVTFDFLGLPTSFALGQTETFTSGGVNLEITAQSQNGPTQIAQKNSPSYHRGLGVTDSLDALGSIDVGQALEIAVPAGFQVANITLTARGGAPQAFDVLIDNMLPGFTGVLTMENTMAIDGRTTIDVTGLAPGSIFTIQANSNTTGGVFLNQIELAALNQVPLPAGILLLGGALVGAGVVARRRA